MTLEELARARDRRAGRDDDVVPRAAARARRLRRIASSRSTRSRTRSRPGRADAGLLIHEGQLTFEDYGLVKVLDLGEWWLLETGLPLPLGVNVVRRDLGDDVIGDVSAVLREAIQCGLDNRAEALEYALQFGRGIDAAVADRFVSMYVNELTQDYGDEGRKAVTELLRRGEALGRVSRARRDRLRPLTSRPVARAVVLSAVRTPIGRYGGALSGVRPDDLAGIAIAAAVERAGVEAGVDRRRLLRLREPGRRGQPQRRPHGRAARGTPGLGRRCHAQPALRVRPLGGRLGLPRGRRRRRGGRRRGRCRVDEPRAARHGQAGHGVPARRRDGLGHDARLALPEPAARGDVPARVDGRDGRERRRAATASRARIRTRSRSARRSAGLRRTRRAASTTSSSRSATSPSTSTRGRRRTPRRSRSSSRRSGRAEP